MEGSTDVGCEKRKNIDLAKNYTCSSKATNVDFLGGGGFSTVVACLTQRHVVVGSVPSSVDGKKFTNPRSFHGRLVDHLRWAAIAAISRRQRYD